MKVRAGLLQWSIGLCIFFIIIISCWIQVCNAANVKLEVPSILQDYSNWCWDASSMAVLEYYGNSVSQCEIANWALGRNDCCGLSESYNTDHPCNSTRNVSQVPSILLNWGVSSNPPLSVSLSQAAVVQEIDAGRPFLMRWWWYPYILGGGHMLVAYGYQVDGGWIEYMDPLYGYQIASYDWVVNGPYHHTWSHTIQITTDPAYILGYVRESGTNNPLIANIDLYREDNTPYKQWSTGDDGIFGLIVKPDNYYLVISALGHDNKRDPSSGTFNVASGENENRGTIYLSTSDTTPPGNPTSCSETHGAADNIWQNGVADPAFNWSGAADGSGSGLKGYYWYFGADSNGNPNNWTTTAGCDPSAVSSGIYYLRVKTEDNAGSQSSPVTLFTFQYDGIAPANGTLSATPGNGQVSLSWSGFSDTVSGIASYKLVYSTGTTPTSCSSGTTIYTGLDTSYNHTGRTNGTTYYYRLCATDNASNQSTGSTNNATPSSSCTDANDDPNNLSFFMTPGVSYGDKICSETDVDWFKLNITSPGMISLNLKVPSSNDDYDLDLYWNSPTNWVSGSTNGPGSDELIELYTNDTGTYYVKVSGGMLSNGHRSYNTSTPYILTYNFTYYLYIVASGNGIVKVDGIPHSLPWTGNYPPGTSVQLEAVPGTGWGFSSWSGIGSTNPVTITININKTITATFNQIDTSPPTGSISINSNDAYTKTTSVTLTLSASDTNGVSEMCISNTNTCSSWETYAPTKPWTLLSGDGTKTVYTWFKDVVGNANSTPYSDTIVLDGTTPIDGTLSATAGNGQVSLTWSGFSDATSGINSYKLVYSPISTPSSCSAGAPIYSGPATSFNHSGLTTGLTYYYRVCATDNANNTSTGVTANATPICPTLGAPSLISPSGSGVSTTPTLDWSDVSGATAYDVQVCSDSGCSSVVQSASDLSSSQWQVSQTLNQGTQYWWRARAINSCGSGAWPTTLSFTTVCPTLGAPSLISPSGSGVSTTPTIDWSDVSGATSYDVQVCSDSNCNTVMQSANVPGTSSQWMVSPALSQGAEYWWRARANNACGSGAWPTTPLGFTTVCPPVINPISDASIGEGTPYTGPTPSLSQGTLPVTWSLATGPSGMSINSSTGVVSWANPTVSGSPHTITIQATNTAGFDTKSWQLTVTPAAFDPPIIDSFTADPTSGAAPLTVDFTCNAHDPDGNIVEYRWDYNNDDVVDETTATGTASAIYTAAGTYQAKVTVVDDDGATTTASPLTISVNGSTQPICVNDAAGLQAALTAAQSNGADDIIMVVEGTYVGNFTYDSSEGNSITLQGGYAPACASRVVNPANTVLDGNHSGRALGLGNSTGGDIVVDGFTIQNGNATYGGGGLSAIGWSAALGKAVNITITNNIITGNTATSYMGAGINAITSSSYPGTAGHITIQGNICTGNTAHEYGGGISARSWSDPGTAGNVTLVNNIITGNTSEQYGGGGVYASSSANTGAAGTITMTNNTITENSATDVGGGASLDASSYSGADGLIFCYNNIVWGNTAPVGADIYVYSAGHTTAANNDATDITVGGGDYDISSINLDPLFVGGGDYHLQPTSPCIDKGLNSAPGIPVTDFEGDPRVIGAAPDIGADEYVPMRYVILHRDGALWFSDTGWVVSTPPYYPGTDYARALEIRTDSYAILHRDGAIYNSVSNWTVSSPPYYPGTNYAVDLKVTSDGEEIILHRDGALWSTDTGWEIGTPPYYPGTAYAKALEVREDGSYVILHYDGAIYDSATGWVVSSPPYHPGTNYAVDMKLESTAYVILHRDGAIWSTSEGWILTAPPYYPGTDYARALQLVGSNYVILHKDGAIYDSVSGWVTTAPPYYPGTEYAVDLEAR